MHGEIIKENILYKKDKKEQNSFTPKMLREKLTELIDSFDKNRFLGIGIGVTGFVNSEK